jgi:hypothetical protein
VSDDTTQFVFLGDLVVDVFLSESHAYASDITEYPTESGSDLVDNIRPKPIEVQVRGIVSNSPIGPVATLRQGGFIQGASDGNYANDAYQQLLKMRSDREPIDIRTSLQTFKNMAMKSLTIVRGSGGDQYLEFDATFVQITVIQNKRSIRVAIPAAQDKTKKDDGTKGSGLVDRKVDPYDGTWYDPDIEGWREGASFNSTKGHWEFFKGRPLGENVAGWQSGDPDHHKTDTGYKQANTASAIVPTVDKKTKKPGVFNMGQGFTLVTDPAAIDTAINSGATDKYGNQLDGPQP